MRLIYSLIGWIVLPFVMVRLMWRGRREPGYRQHWKERLGFYQITCSVPVVWVHAVSVGETRAAQPLIEALLHHPAQYSIVLTHMTPTGRVTGQDLFARHGTRLIQVYCPYDLNLIVQRFIRHFAPMLTVLIETEVWPNIMAQCAARDIPVVLVNGRLSQRSFDRAQWLGSLIKNAARHLHSVAAQTEADAERFRKLGISSVTVTGNMKFDITPSSNAFSTGKIWRQKLGARFVLLCASTREGEELLILDALKQNVKRDVLVVIVPRHPQRFEEVASLIQAHGFTMCRRSQWKEEQLPDSIQIVLGDSMGELFAYYGACDVAYIGGSLLPLGGQNLIEAFMLGKPVLIGPHTFNFATVTEDAVSAGCALRLTDAHDMIHQMLNLMHDQIAYQKMSTQAMFFSKHYQGATTKTMELLQPLLIIS